MIYLLVPEEKKILKNEIIDEIKFITFPDWIPYFQQPLLLEKHQKNCSCSYCSTPGLLNHRGKNINFFGLFWFCLPEDRSWNSWRVVFWKKKGYNYYLRWTLKRKE